MSNELQNKKYLMEMPRVLDLVEATTEVEAKIKFRDQLVKLAEGSAVKVEELKQDSPAAKKLSRLMGLTPPPGVDSSKIYLGPEGADILFGKDLVQHVGFTTDNDVLFRPISDLLAKPEVDSKMA